MIAGVVSPVNQLTADAELAEATIVGALQNETRIYAIKAVDQGVGCRDLNFPFSVQQSEKIFAFIRELLANGV